jgi:transposase
MGVFIVTRRFKETGVPKPRKSDPKVLELQRNRTLNPHAATVADPLFKTNPFFDSRDLLQVRYEMLRRHSIEGMSIRDSALAFGVSRPTFYHVQAALTQSGLAGLLPKQRGPKERHKLSDAVLDYVHALKIAEPGLTTAQCVQAIEKHFGMTIHRRSLERALRGKKKLRKSP